MSDPVSYDSSFPELLVLEALQPDPALTMDGLIERVPQLSWSELFAVVDRLSRRGSILLKRRGFEYELSLVA